MKGHKLQESHNPKKTAKAGNFVTLHYVGKLADGTVFESTSKKPLRITVGQRNTIQGLEEGVVGMHVGEKKRIVIKPDKAYGKYHKDLIQTIPLSKIPDEITPKVGMVINQTTQKGTTLYWKVLEVHTDEVVIDVNHPLAGKTLVFDVVIMDIQ